MSTPWGYIQHSKCVTPGVSWVYTAGHGGLRIRRLFAEANLSSAARRRGIVGAALSVKDSSGMKKIVIMQSRAGSF